MPARATSKIQLFHPVVERVLDVVIKGVLNVWVTTKLSGLALPFLRHTDIVACESRHQFEIGKVLQEKAGTLGGKDHRNKSYDLEPTVTTDSGHNILDFRRCIFVWVYPSEEWLFDG